MQDILQNNFQIGEIMESVLKSAIAAWLGLSIERIKAEREEIAGNNLDSFTLSKPFFKPDSIFQFFYQNIKNNQHNHDIVEITTEIIKNKCRLEFWRFLAAGVLEFFYFYFGGGGFSASFLVDVFLVITLFLSDLVIGGGGGVNGGLGWQWKVGGFNNPKPTGI